MSTGNDFGTSLTNGFTSLYNSAKATTQSLVQKASQAITDATGYVNQQAQATKEWYSGIVQSGQASLVNTAEHFIADSDLSGPLGDLEPELSPFDFEQLEYPIGDMLARYPYYMTFYINVPTTRSRFNTQFKGVVAGEKLGTINVEATNAQLGLTSRETNRQKGGSAQAQTIGIPKVSQDVIDLTRPTVRTAYSIRLYMPDTLQWNFRQSWRDPHLSDTGLISKLAPVMSIKEGFESGTYSGMVAGVAQAGKLLTEKFTSLPEGTVLAHFGYTVNPMIDVIYTSPDLRTFTMEFNFAPRSPREAQEVLRIIRAFKFYSAPEVPKTSAYGYLMIPPGDFDIEFSVKALGKITTCTLLNVDLDYSPNGFAAYANPANVSDGMPVNIRMRLEFRETEYITKDLVLRGY